MITLITLIVEAVAIVLAEKIDNPIFWWAPFIVLVVALIVVMVLTIVRPEFLIKGSSSLTVRFNFKNAKDINLSRDKCYFEIYNSNGKKTDFGNFRPINGSGGWYFVLPSKVVPSDTVYFKLIDVTNNTWEIRDFKLCDIDKEPRQL